MYRKSSGHWRIFRLSVLLFLAAAALSAAAGKAAARDAGIDAVSVELAQTGKYALERGWTVYRDAIVQADRFAETCNPAFKGLAGQAVSLPDIWGPALTTDVTTGHGVATYCLDLALPATSQFLALSMGTTRSVYSIHAV